MCVIGCLVVMAQHCGPVIVDASVLEIKSKLKVVLEFVIIATFVEQVAQ